MPIAAIAVIYFMGALFIRDVTYLTLNKHQDKKEHVQTIAKPTENAKLETK